MKIEEIQDNEIYRNKKNKKLYKVLNNNVINATNANDNDTMVLYIVLDDKRNLQFVREINEFCLKFEKSSN